MDADPEQTTNFNPQQQSQYITTLIQHAFQGKGI
jgi:hypothetical protein